MRTTGYGQPSRSLGAVIGNVLGLPPAKPFGPSYDVRGGPWVLNAAPAPQPVTGHEDARSVSDPGFLDTSPPGLPPMNAPDGNQPTPIAGTKPDYRAMLAEAIGPRPELHGLRKWAGIIGPALMAATGNQAGANAMMEQIAAPRREWDERNREAQLAAVKWGREDAMAEAKRNEPQYFSGNEDRVRFDPRTRAVERVYDAPQDFEDYARAQGLDPGTDGYFNAVEDYVLRGNGPTAFKYDRDLEVVRNAGRIASEAARQANRERLRGLPTYRDTHPAPARPRASQGSPRERLPVVNSPAEAAQLPPGTRFKTPDGKVKVRP